MKTKPEPTQFAVCLSNRGYAASLVVRRLYAVIDDPVAARRGLVRLIDESGEDYLYPKRMFAPVELPAAVKRRFSPTSKSAR